MRIGLLTMALACGARSSLEDPREVQDANAPDTAVVDGCVPHDVLLLVADDGALSTFEPTSNAFTPLTTLHCASTLPFHPSSLTTNPQTGDFLLSTKEGEIFAITPEDWKCAKQSNLGVGDGNVLFGLATTGKGSTAKVVASAVISGIYGLWALDASSAFVAGLGQRGPCKITGSDLPALYGLCAPNYGVTVFVGISAQEKFDLAIPVEWGADRKQSLAVARNTIFHIFSTSKAGESNVYSYNLIDHVLRPMRTVPGAITGSVHTTLCL